MDWWNLLEPLGDRNIIIINVATLKTAHMCVVTMIETFGIEANDLFVVLRHHFRWRRFARFFVCPRQHMRQKKTIRNCLDVTHR